MASRTSGAAAQPGTTPGAIPLSALAAALAALLTSALSGCANAPASPAAQEARATTSAPATDSTDEARMVSATGAEPGIANPMPASPAASLAGTATPFATRNALYTPVSFTSLPGWKTDNVAESWDAFARSCAVLGGRAGWSAPCAASRTVDANDGNAVRRFFEDNFTVYQIRNVDRSSRGVLTGYYQPILKGSRKFGAPYVYPVYGTPRDMLFLDARRLPPNARGGKVAARIEGRTVIPLTTLSMGNTKGVYALDTGDSIPDIRDKKLRLRLAGNRIVPYWSRAEIERGHINAPVLAYVEDPAMLYSMQLQGTGKIRLTDGTTLQLAYAEQNGLAFNPPIASASSKGRKVLVRGVEIDLEEGAVSGGTTQGGDAPASDDAPRSPLLRGADGASDTASVAADDPADPPNSPLLRGFRIRPNLPQGVQAARVSTQAAAPDQRADQPPEQRAEQPAPLSTAAPLGYTFASSDPSYVFFRTVPESSGGPIGSLGVPLSAGRSAAIDPRTTPLGAPVFVNASPAGSGAPVTRLMMAQDSGGAIRGAVRADYFFGAGPQAQQDASRMRQPTEMWVLLPKGLRISAKESGVRLRGGPAESSADCVVQDPVFCVDDTP